MTEGVTTRDGLLDGKVRLRQPATGFRATIDPVLLAAAIDADAGFEIADLGAGTGAAALCAAWRLPDARITGYELAEELVTVANQNAEENGQTDRVAFEVADVLDRRGLPDGRYDQVMTNPPFLPADAGTPSDDPVRDRALRLDLNQLPDWFRAAAKVLRPGGHATCIFASAHLEHLLAAMAPRFGGLRIFPLWKSLNQPAKRVLVRARKDSRGLTQIMPGLVLHNPDGTFTEAADKVLRNGGPIDMAGA